MNASSRSSLYTISIVLSAVVAVVTLATLLTLNVISAVQVDTWVENLMYAVAVVGQVVAIIAGFVAKKNLTPDPTPIPEPEPVASDEVWHDGNF